MAQNQSSRWLSIYFGLFATVAAGLLGLGQASWNLPLFVGICVLVSMLYTDIFGWFSLHRFAVYAGMIGGAAYAILEFVRNSGADPLIAVGNLLVYVQVPLLFQKKTKRVFEQLGVFLLLELVVAALVNDNVLYGVLMLPILGIGSATLMALAQYSSDLRHNESMSESTNWIARFLHWMGIEHMVSRKYSGVTLSAIPQGIQSFVEKPSVAPISKWLTSVLPMSLSVLVFSIAYFYMLPRLHSGSYEFASWNNASVGFSERISLKYIGELLQSDSPVFKMSMRDNRNKTNYRPAQPPYIRASVNYIYLDGPGRERGSWEQADTYFSIDGVFGDIPPDIELESEVKESTDDITISVIEKTNLVSTVPAIPPFSHPPTNESGLNFTMCFRDWRMIDFNDRPQNQKKVKRRYSYRSLAFVNGLDSPVLPDYGDTFRDSIPKIGSGRSTEMYYAGDLTNFPVSLECIVPFRNKVLESSAEPLNDAVSKALFLENYFANGTDFRYTLKLTGPIDDSIDPIADFLLNKKEGHCQYFASSLALLLRSLKIPSRLVIGFRPSEYNEVGKYFLVQQKHTHVWVEAYFSKAQLDAKGIPIPSWVSKGAWIRLDPTPPGENSNAGGSFRMSNGQTFEAMQDLWNEMVMNMDKNRQSSLMSLFAQSSSESYAVYWLQLQGAIAQMQSSRFIGGLLSPEKWFSWRVALTIILIGALAAIAYQSLVYFFPNLVPKWRRKRSDRNTRTSRIEFYNRAIKALKRYGLRREAWQTQREFFQIASQSLSAIQIPFDADLISRVFYELRFGDTTSISDEDSQKIDHQIHTIELNARSR